MTLPEVVDTERLRLPLWTADDVARPARRRAAAPGWHRDFPREDDRDAASLWRDGDPWGPRSIELDGVVVGSIGFFGPPEPADDGVARDRGRLRPGRGRPRCAGWPPRR